MRARWLQTDGVSLFYQQVNFVIMTRVVKL